MDELFPFVVTFFEPLDPGGAVLKHHAWTRFYPSLLHAAFDAPQAVQSAYVLARDIQVSLHQGFYPQPGYPAAPCKYPVMPVFTK